MNLITNEDAATDPLTLDPFSFHGHTASVIKGIGGTHPNTDPTYAFHTPYVKLASGRAKFTVQFADLQAKQGTLVLRVHILPDAPGSAASMVTSERIQLNRLVLIGGQIMVEFEAFRDATYALMGLVAGETDASASDILITAEWPYDAERDQASLRGDGAPTRFGTDSLKPAAALVSLSPPTLVQPMSQVATASQLREGIYRDWRARLGLDALPALECWSNVYLAQVLKCYGLINGGARGLVLGPVAPSLLAFLAGSGCHIVVVDSVLPEAVPPSVELRMTETLRQMPDGLVDFDFVMSGFLANRLGSTAEIQALVDWSFSYLRPKGLTAHVLRTGDGPADFTRSGVERLALTLLSRGHLLSQLRPTIYRPASDFEMGACGLVARRTTRLV